MRQKTVVSWQRCILHAALVAALLAAAPGSAAADRLQPLPGSPFAFGGTGSWQIPALSPDGARLYVSSYGSANIMRLDLAADGTPIFGGLFPSAQPAPGLGGVAFAPSGERLYAGSTSGIALHAVGPAGDLSDPRIFPAQVWSDPLNGLAYVPLAVGDFLYVNDNNAPNTVSAWSVGPDGSLAYRASYATGGNGSGPMFSSLIAAPRLVAHGNRLFVLDAPGQGALGSSTIAVFDIGLDGVLGAVPGSPFDMGERAGAIAIHPSGEILYAGGGGTSTQPTAVIELRVAPDGSLERTRRVSVAGMTGKPNGLAVDPTGRWLAFTGANAGTLGVVDAVTLQPIDGGVVPDPAAAGVVFDASRRVYVGHSGGGAVIGVFQVVRASAPAVSCAGTPDSPSVLELDASSCAVTVDPANGLAGTCADGGGGLASCTLAGSSALRLGPGSHAIEVVGAAPDGSTASCTSYLSVADVTPPAVSVGPSPAVLWPPNHALVAVDLGASAWDACGGNLPVECTARSSEPDDEAADGSTSPDVAWTGGGLWLRAERAADGPGRVYSLECRASDVTGNVGTAASAVAVPHDLAP